MGSKVVGHHGVKVMRWYRCKTIQFQGNYKATTSSLCSYCARPEARWAQPVVQVVLGDVAKGGGQVRGGGGGGCGGQRWRKKEMTILDKVWYG